MLVASSRLGDLDVDEESIFDVPEGMLGFPDLRRLALIAHDDDGAYYWLQSVDQPDLAFLAVVPWRFFPAYEAVLSTEDEAALGLEDPADAFLLCLVSVRHGATVEASANLLGPLVTNLRTRQARQVVLADSGYPARAPLAAP